MAVKEIPAVERSIRENQRFLDGIDAEMRAENYGSPLWLAKQSDRDREIYIDTQAKLGYLPRRDHGWTQPFYNLGYGIEKGVTGAMYGLGTLGENLIRDTGIDPEFRSAAKEAAQRMQKNNPHWYNASDSENWLDKAADIVGSSLPDTVISGVLGLSGNEYLPLAYMAAAHAGPALERNKKYGMGNAGAWTEAAVEGALVGWLENYIGNTAKAVKMAKKAHFRVQGGQAIKSLESMSAKKAAIRELMGQSYKQLGKKNALNMWERLLKNAGLDKGWKRSLVNWGTDALGEASEEGLQYMAEAFGGTLAQMAGKGDSFSDALQNNFSFAELWDNTYGGFVGGLGIGPIMNGVEMGVQKGYRAAKKYQLKSDIRNNIGLDGKFANQAAEDILNGVKPEEAINKAITANIAEVRQNSQTEQAAGGENSAAEPGTNAAAPDANALRGAWINHYADASEDSIRAEAYDLRIPNAEKLPASELVKALVDHHVNADLNRIAEQYYSGGNAETGEAAPAPAAPATPQEAVNAAPTAPADNNVPAAQTAAPTAASQVAPEAAPISDAAELPGGNTDFDPEALSNPATPGEAAGTAVNPAASESGRFTLTPEEHLDADAVNFYNTQYGIDAAPVERGDFVAAGYDNAGLPLTLGYAQNVADSLGAGRIVPVQTFADEETGRSTGVDFSGISSGDPRAMGRMLVNMEHNASPEQMLHSSLHEIVHNLIRNNEDAYKILVERILPLVYDQKAFDERFKRYANNRQHTQAPANRDAARKEFICDLTADAMKTERFWKAAEKYNPSLARKLLDALVELLDKVRSIIGYRHDHNLEVFGNNIEKVIDLAAQFVADPNTMNDVETETAGKADTSDISDTSDGKAKKTAEKNNNLFQYFTGTFAEFWQKIKKFPKNELLKRIIAPMSDRVLNFLNSKGAAIDSDFKHVMDNFAVQHILKEHGGESERLRGQVPITRQDFENAEDVIANFDYIGVDDKNGIIYAKRMPDGTMLYIEEARRGRKELALTSMRKMAGNIPNDLMRILTPASDLNVQDDSAMPPDKKSIQQIEKRAGREGGQVLVTESDSAQGASGLHALSSGSTDNITDAEEKSSGQAEKNATSDTDELPLFDQAAEKNAAPEAATDKAWGADNKVISRNAYEEAKARILKRLNGRLNAGIDPGILADGVVIAAFHIEAGTRKFAEFAKKMIADLGDNIRPFLKSLYEGARRYPGMENVAAEMDATSDVDIFDIENADFSEKSDAGTLKNTESGDKLGKSEHTQNQKEKSGDGDGQGTAGDVAGRLRTAGASAASDGLSQGVSDRPAGAEKTAGVHLSEGGMVRQNSLQAGKGSSDVSGVSRGGLVRQGTGEVDADGDRPRRPAVERADAERGQQRKRVRPAGISGDIRKLNAGNFRIAPETEIVPTGEVGKTRANIAAIRLIKQLEAEKRAATAEEKAVLAKYTGWGGLPQVFEYGNPFYRELRELLTPAEYAAARASTINAHYTSREVITEMWSAAARLGFTGGRVGEFGAGVGHFLGLVPNKLADKTLFRAVELDSITGKILQYLYPGADVTIDGLEHTKIAGNSLDMVIGNFPFAKEGPFDKNYPKFNLHNYFFARAIDAVKPGGIVVAVTSNSTLDSISPEARKYFAERADFIGAIRLPNNAFKKNAGTEVVTDIIILRKHDGTESQLNKTPFLRSLPVEGVSTDENGIRVNEYFVAHPEMVLGKITAAGSMYRAESMTVESSASAEELQKQIREAVKKLPADIIAQKGAQIVTDTADITLTDEQKKSMRAGEIFASPIGQLMVYQDGKGVPLTKHLGKTLSANEIKKINSFLKLKGVYNALLDLMRSDATDAEVKAKQRELNAAYDAHVAKFGAISNTQIHRNLVNDPGYLRMSALENETKRSDGKTVYKKSDVFTTRTVRKTAIPTHADNAADAAVISINYAGKLDFGFMEKLTGKSREDLTAELLDSGDFFVDPVSGQLVEKEEYLSGNIADKIMDAERELEAHPEYAANIKALKDVMPKPKEIGKISFSLGATWIPANLIEKWLGTFNVRANVKYNATKDMHDTPNVWTVKIVNPGLVTQYQIGGKTIEDLVQDALNMHRTKVYKRGVDGKPVLDRDATKTASDLQEELKRSFVDFVRGNAESSSIIEDIYNKTYNVFVTRKIDPAKCLEVYPGAADTINGKPFRLREHQRAVVSRCIRGNTLIAHCVGAGKTVEMITANMELIRLGLATKGLIVVQKSTLGQFALEAQQLYPNARILAADEKSMEKKNRRRFLSKIANGSYDMVIMAHSSFDNLLLSPELQRQQIQDAIDEVVEAIEEAAREQGKRSPSVKALERKRKSLLGRMEKLQSVTNAEDTFYFDELGFDAIFVDEAHAYKKLDFFTKLGNIKGLDRSASSRAFNMKGKLDFIRSKTNGRNIYFATGTPVTNTLAEVWNMIRMVSPEALEEFNVQTFDRFASTFTNTVTGIEQSAAMTWKMVERFTEFTNIEELHKFITGTMDIVLPEDLKGVKRPKIKGGEATYVTSKMTSPLQRFMGQLKQLYEAFDAAPPKQRREFSAIPLMVYELARKASIDMRLVNENNIDDPDSKLNAVVNNAMERYRSSDSVKGAQAIFCDLYRLVDKNTGQEKFNVYEEIKRKLVARGVPASEIAIINDYNTDNAKSALFDAVNSGTVRFIMGSTEKLGTGVNIQERLCALHHIDAPPRPSDMEQRNGRIIRQGNIIEEPEILCYAVDRTLDSFAYAMLARKAKFINAALKGRASESGNLEVVEDDVVSYAQFSAETSGDKRAVRYVELNKRLSDLENSKRRHQKNVYDAAGNIERYTANAEVTVKAIRDVENFIDKFGNIDLKTADIAVDGKKLSGERKDVMRQLDEQVFERLATSPYFHFEVKIGDLKLRIDSNELINLGGPASYQTRYTIQNLQSNLGVSIAGDVNGAQGLMQSLNSLIKKKTAELDALREKEKSLRGLVEQQKAIQKSKFAGEEELEEVRSEHTKLENELAEEAKKNGEKENHITIGQAAAMLGLDTSDLEVEDDAADDGDVAYSMAEDEETAEQGYSLENAVPSKDGYHVERVNENAGRDLNAAQGVVCEKINQVFDPADVPATGAMGWIRQKVKDFAKLHPLPEHCHVPAFGEDVHITKSSMRSVASHRGKDAKFNLVPVIPEMLKNAILVQTESLRKKDGHILAKSHILAAKVRYGADERYVAVMVVHESNGQFYYDHELLVLEEGKLGREINLEDDKNRATSVRRKPIHTKEPSSHVTLMLNVVRNALLSSGFDVKNPENVAFSMPGDEDFGKDGVDYRRKIDPMFDFIMEYSDSGIVNPGLKHAGEDFHGSTFIPEAYRKPKPVKGALERQTVFLARMEKWQNTLANAPGTPLDELAAAYVRKFGGDEADVEEKILEKLRHLNRNTLRSERADDRREFAEHEREENARAAEEYKAELDDKELEEVNRRFDDELDRQIAGEHPPRHVYDLGMPGSILKSCGVPDESIRLAAATIDVKRGDPTHPFDIADLKGLPKALQNPIGVFAYGDKTKSQNVIVDLKHGDRHFLVGIHFSAGNSQINEIRGLFPKDAPAWLNWIQQGKALYLNKEKIETVIDSLRADGAQRGTDLHGVPSYLNLDSVLNIVRNFDNASLDYSGHRMANPVREEGAYRKEVQQTIDEHKFSESKSNDDAREKAREWIGKQGGAAPAMNEVMRGMAPGGSVGVMAREEILNSPDFRGMSKDDRNVFLNFDAEQRSMAGQTLQARRDALRRFENVDDVRNFIENETREMSGDQYDDFREDVKQRTGIDIEKLPEDIANDKRKLDRLLTEVLTRKRTWLQSLPDALYEFWINALLSGPRTHMINTASNLVNIAYELGPKRMVEAAVNGMLRLVGKDFAYGATFGEYRKIFGFVNWSEVKRAWTDAFALDVINSDGKLDPHAPAIRGKAGYYIRSISRALKAADAVAKAILRPIEAASHAYREGVKQGLSGQKLHDFMTEQLADETSAARQYGDKRAKEITFTGEIGNGKLDSIVSWIIQKKQESSWSGWLFRLAFPFVSTPYNITKQIFRKSHLGSLNLMYQTIQAMQGKRKFDNEYLQLVAEQILVWGATLLLSGIGGGDDDDLPFITGTGAMYGTNKGKFERLHVPPHSIRICGKWYDYSRLEPVADVITHIGNMVNHFRGRTPGLSFWQVQTQFVKHTLDKSYLNTIHEIIQLAEADEYTLKNAGANFISSWIPNVVRQTLQYSDDNIREQAGADFWELTANRAGFRVLAPKVDYFGRPIPKDAVASTGGCWLWRFAPVRSQEAKYGDEADRVFLKYNQLHPDEAYFPGLPGRKNLTNAQYHDLAERSGRIAHEKILRMIRRGEIKTDQPTEDDIKKIKAVFAQARKSARNELGLP